MSSLVSDLPPASTAGRFPAPAPERDLFDPQYCHSMVETVYAPILDYWFRPQVFGEANLPANGPAILIANHSGTALPHDAVALDAFLWRRAGLDPSAKMRSMFEPALAQHWWLRLLGLDDFWRRCGGVDMTFDNFDRLLARADRVIYYPEGVPGIGKGFQHRYQLQRFHTSFVLLAARHHAPVVPVYVVNGEYVMPLHFTLRPLDRVMQLLFGVPYLPLPAGILAMIFPFLWFIAFPAQLTFVVGAPIDIAALLREEQLGEPAPSDSAPTKTQLQRVADRVREQMQRELTRLEAKYGGDAYQARRLGQLLRRAGKAWWRAITFFWPISFLTHDRDRARPPARNWLHAIVRDLDLLAFYLPAGWPLLTLSRLVRRPPYGYRGLSRAERRARRGEFVWRLSERPLPPREDARAAVAARASVTSAAGLPAVDSRRASVATAPATARDAAPH